MLEKETGKVYEALFGKEMPKDMVEIKFEHGVILMKNDDYNYAMAADSSPAKTNAAKYGDRSDDVIARIYKESATGGDYFCFGNIQKYITRFCKEGSPKAGNLTDLIKAKDYLERMIEMNKDKVKPEVIE